jgi:hypothetical protein
MVDDILPNKVEISFHDHEWRSDVLESLAAALAPATETTRPNEPEKQALLYGSTEDPSKRPFQEDPFHAKPTYVKL